MAEPIKNVGTPVRGLKEVSALTTATGVAHTSSTVITINDDAVLDEWANNGVAVHRIRGDGRAWFKVLSSAPASPVVGDMWVEQDATLGTVLRVRGSTGTITYGSSDTGNLEVTASAALLQGHAVYGTVSGLAYAQAVIDSNKRYRIAGVMIADVASTETGAVITNGKHLQMDDWSLLTGATALVPGSDYWLSSTPGRYTTSPDAAVAARVGRAVSDDTLLVDTSLCVIQ